MSVIVTRGRRFNIKLTSSMGWPNRMLTPKRELFQYKLRYHNATQHRDELRSGPLVARIDILCPEGARRGIQR